MNNDFLLNTNKINNQKVSTDSSSLSKLEKKEGSSLFDSLMNEAKLSYSKDKETSTDSEKQNIKKDIKEENHTLNKDNPKKTIQKNDTQNLNTSDKIKSIDSSSQNSTQIESKLDNIVQNNTQTELTESKLNNMVQNNIKTESIEKTIISPNKITSLENNNDNSNSESLDKLVKKLVEIVVQAVKEKVEEPKDNKSKTVDKSDNLQDASNTSIADKSTSKESTKIVNSTSLQLDESEKVENNIETSKTSDIKNKTPFPSNIKEFKTTIENKIDVISNSVENIEEEVKNLKNDTLENTSSKKEISTTNTSTNIYNEVKIVKETVSQINTKIEELDSPSLDKPDLDLTKKDNVDIKSENLKIEKNNVIKNVDIINDSASDIKDILDTNSNISKSTMSDKIEEKIGVIKDVIIDIKDQVSNIVVNTRDIDKIVKETKSEVIESSKVLSSTSIATDEESKNSKTPLLASMFLNAQKNTKEQTSMVQINDAKNNILNNKTLESVKQSADQLDLNLEETDVEHTEEQGKRIHRDEENKDSKKLSTASSLSTNLINNKTLNMAVINQKLESSDLVKDQSSITQKQIEIPETEEKKIQTVEIIVPKEAIQSLQSKIIGAQQKVGSFMSDVAKNMYLNYNPPVTAFRVNLNPANLGSVSIMMKANKVDNTLSVSMNLSNSNTLEAFNENKNVLQNAIQRQFSENSNITIDLGLQTENSENTFSSFHQEQNKKEESSSEQKNEQNTVNEIEEEKEIIPNNDYM